MPDLDHSLPEASLRPLPQHIGDFLLPLQRLLLMFFCLLLRAGRLSNPSQATHPVLCSVPVTLTCVPMTAEYPCPGPSPAGRPAAALWASRKNPLQGVTEWFRRFLPVSWALLLFWLPRFNKWHHHPCVRYAGHLMVCFELSPSSPSPDMLAIPDATCTRRQKRLRFGVAGKLSQLNT